MVRIGRAARSLIALAAALLSLAAAAAPGRAQSLQRLTVVSFTLSADTAKPQLEVPFHLIVALHVREDVPQIDNINLPILAELELEGDERTTQAGPRGTDYREVITVVAHHTGEIALAPATLQAIDARDGKAKQWSTNPLTLVVTGGALEPVQPNALARWFANADVRGTIELFLGIGAALLVIVLFVRRRPAPPRAVVVAPAPPAPAPPPPPAAKPRSRRDQFQDALSVLRTERTRASAVRVRAAVWRTIGAAEGATLGDVLRRPETSDPPLRDVLRALERAAFTYDDDLARAIGDACDALERYLA